MVKGGRMALGLTGVSIRARWLVYGRVCRVGQQGAVTSGDGCSSPDPFHDATRWRLGIRGLLYGVIEARRQGEWCGAAALRTPEGVLVFAPGPRHDLPTFSSSLYQRRAARAIVGLIGRVGAL